MEISNKYCKQCGKAFHGTMSCVAHPQEIVYSNRSNKFQIGEVYLVGEWSKW